MSSVMRFDEWQDSNGVPVLDGAGGNLALGKILQVVQTVETGIVDYSFATEPAGTRMTALDTTITPSSTSSKILIVANLSVTCGNNDGLAFRLLGGNTAGAIGDAAGSRTRALTGVASSAVVRNPGATTIMFLDSPATTSPITYGVEAIGRVTLSMPIRLNRGSDQSGLPAGFGDTDAVQTRRSISTFTVMEVAG